MDDGGRGGDGVICVGGFFGRCGFVAFRFVLAFYTLALRIVELFEYDQE